MSKIDYAAVSSKLSELFYKQIELEKSLTRDADDRIDDMYGRASSTKASFAAEDWFEEEKARVLEESGWTLEDYTAEEEKEHREFYENLAKPSEDHPVGEFVHDEGDEDEWEIGAH